MSQLVDRRVAPTNANANGNAYANATALAKSSERRSQGSLRRTTVLVVDDEADIRELLELTLVRMGLGVELAGSVAEAKQKLADATFDLCLTDMRLPDGEGLAVVQYIAEHAPTTPVAVITAHGSAENAVAALKSGAFDYVSKPLSLAHLRTLVKSALSLPEANAPATTIGADRLLGTSEPIEQIRLMIGKLARSQAPVYITGESGSGKELAARLIHSNGARRERSFVPVNCGAIPDNLVESEFFGYRKGAFTGAGEDRDGFFHAANGGTLFLDEVADLPLAIQVKLLRAIQEKRVRKVGATTEDPVDVRLICATHQNLAKLVETGKFRQDLYYRLAVIEMRMPSLRECREDIPLLAETILDRIADDAGDAPVKLTAEARTALLGYDFPGNIRELENVLERATALSGGMAIEPDDLRITPSSSANPAANEASGQGNEANTAGSAAGTNAASVAAELTALAEGNGKWPLTAYLDRLERQAILEALEKTRFNRTAAAKVLGITFRALRYRMERLEIQ